MESLGPSWRLCFIKEDDGLASIVDMDVGYSGSHYQTVNQNGFLSRPPVTLERVFLLRGLLDFMMPFINPISWMLAFFARKKKRGKKQPIENKLYIK
ncbi:hypothetical protein EPI10_001663 [Gossypium australe]|uniref:Uncharacterized protein n=1 Tax=Gossypium australe TaxID=47621 RepID=A0A5B6VBJ8_9ROSI|nr:hypothetical protein EPI10_001663 [Gossypium australe]